MPLASLGMPSHLLSGLLDDEVVELGKVADLVDLCALPYLLVKLH
jgi:hypothetical protein